MTDRLVQMVVSIALETSCESCARILNSLKIKISGDTVIRTILKYYYRQSKPECGDVIGIDDFALKRGHTYGTIIVNEQTHATVALLEGRDENTIKEWLKNNRHIKTITRDRAGAYAKAIEEILPDCIQVADRFHIHKNLMDYVNQILKRELPSNIKFIEDDVSKEHTGDKKNQTD